jgi:hypothetical protein
MNNQDQSKPLTKTLHDEGYQESGLRILGRIIARELIKQRRGNEDKARNRKPDDLTASGDAV